MHTHGLLLGSFIHWAKRAETSSLHSGTPLEQAVLMALISLYLPQGGTQSASLAQAPPGSLADTHARRVAGKGSV